MKVFTVGVVGTGSIARQVHLPVLANLPNARVAWVADVDVKSSAEAAVACGVPAVAASATPAGLPPSDVVLLATPVGTRMAYYEALASRGSAVLAEKPFAPTLSEHRRALGLFPPHRLACGYMRRTYESTQILRAAIGEAWFGKLARLRISEGARTTRTGVDRSHFDDPGAAGGGVLMSLGTHAVDLAFHLTGATKFEVISARFQFDGPIDRKVEAVLRLMDAPSLPPGGVELELTVSWLDRQENRVEAVFPEARLVTGTSPGVPVSLHGLADSRPRVVLAPPRPGPTTSYQAFFTEWDWFLRDLERGVASPISAASAEPAAAAVEALYAAGRKS